jgi:hypothetical protein
MGPELDDLTSRYLPCEWTFMALQHALIQPIQEIVAG